jgi:hypothetical protein
MRAFDQLHLDNKLKKSIFPFNNTPHSHTRPSEVSILLSGMKFIQVKSTMR